MALPGGGRGAAWLSGWQVAAPHLLQRRALGPQVSAEGARVPGRPQPRLLDDPALQALFPMDATPNLLLQLRGARICGLNQEKAPLFGPRRSVRLALPAHSATTLGFGAKNPEVAVAFPSEGHADVATTRPGHPL